MTSTVDQSIRQGLSEAINYASNVADLSKYGVYVPNDINVKAIRAKLDMVIRSTGTGKF